MVEKIKLRLVVQMENLKNWFIIESCFTYLNYPKKIFCIAILTWVNQIRHFCDDNVGTGLPRLDTGNERAGNGGEQTASCLWWTGSAGGWLCGLICWLMPIYGDLLTSGEEVGLFASGLSHIGEATSVLGWSMVTSLTGEAERLRRPEDDEVLYETSMWGSPGDNILLWILLAIVFLLQHTISVQSMIPISTNPIRTLVPTWEYNKAWCLYQY